MYSFFLVGTKAQEVGALLVYVRVCPFCVLGLVVARRTFGLHWCAICGARSGPAVDPLEKATTSVSCQEVFTCFDP